MNIRINFINVVIALLVSLAPVAVGYWLGKQPEKPNILEYNFFVVNRHQPFLDSNDKFSIAYNGKILGDLQLARYTILNKSNTDIGKVTIYFQIKSGVNQLLFVDCQKPNLFPKEAIKCEKSSADSYRLDLDFLNRNHSELEVNFYFSGPVNPEIEIISGTKGLQLLKAEIPTLGGLDNTYVLKMLSIIITLYAIIVLIIFRIWRRKGIKFVVIKSTKNADTNINDKERSGIS